MQEDGWDEQQVMHLVVYWVSEDVEQLDVNVYDASQLADGAFLAMQAVGWEEQQVMRSVDGLEDLADVDV
jgi:hypothetical protein